MKLRAWAALAAALVVGVNVRGVPDRPDKKRKGDPLQQQMKRVQGTWTAAGWVMLEKKIEGTARLTVRANRWSLRLNGELIRGTFKLYPAKKPRAFDAKVISGTGRGSTFLGLYEQKGDTLTFCWCFDPSTRPGELTAKSTKCFFFVMKRPRP
jgi:uncharacterized protein (TIGR03067 family)